MRVIYLAPSRREVLVDGDRFERFGARYELGAVEPALDGPRRVTASCDRILPFMKCNHIVTSYDYDQQL